MAKEAKKLEKEKLKEEKEKLKLEKGKKKDDKQTSLDATLKANSSIAKPSESEEVGKRSDPPQSTEELVKEVTTPKPEVTVAAESPKVPVSQTGSAKKIDKKQV